MAFGCGIANTQSLRSLAGCGAAHVQQHAERQQQPAMWPRRKCMIELRFLKKLKPASVFGAGDKSRFKMLNNSQAPEHTPLPGFDSYNMGSG